MTPIPLEVKQDMREFLEAQIINDPMRRAVGAITEPEKMRNEKFLDDLWLFINQRAAARAITDQHHEAGN